MIKILVCGDNHYDLDIIKRLLIKYNDCDYYLHTGDSELCAIDIKPFISVRGNNDYDLNNMPKERIIKISDKYSIFMTHGHFLYSEGYTYLSNETIANECNICIFGHLHRYIDIEENGVRILNPGSCRSNRDGTKPSFALIYIDDNSINIEKHTIDELH